MLPWYVSSVEISLRAFSQTAANARKWETDEMDFHHLAEEFAQFTADGTLTGGTVLARKSVSATLGGRGRA